MPEPPVGAAARGVDGRGATVEGAAPTGTPRTVHLTPLGHAVLAVPPELTADHFSLLGFWPIGSVAVWGQQK